MKIYKYYYKFFYPFSFSGRSFEPLYAASDRSFKSGEDHRTTTLKRIENYLTRMGGVVRDGHACILRAICEVKFKFALFYYQS